MSIHARRTLFQSILFGLVLQFYVVVSHSSAQSAAWISFAPADEEITALIPGRPIVRTYRTGAPPGIPDNRRERILAHRVYNGYGDGLIFIIESLKAERPEKVSEQMLSLVDKTGIFERLIFDGVPAELFRTSINHRYATYTKHTLRFTTTNHLYVIQLMVLEEYSAGVDRFLSSFGLRKPGEQSTSIEQPVPEDAGEVLTNNEVSRRAIIVWKADPMYTEDARKHQTRGTVILDVVYGKNGYMGEITVVQGLDHGMTESAIEAARNIRFFPALKDGKPVSYRNRVEYHFNLY